MLSAEEISLDSLRKALKNENIKIFGVRSHSKASETYIDVVFNYPQDRQAWNGAVPVEYRRTGTFAKDEVEMAKMINHAYDLMQPKNRPSWLKEQRAFWDACNKSVTRPFFEVLGSFKWTCVHCGLPNNPNWARRFQDIKEFGYTTATHTRMLCGNCGKNTTHVILLPLPRGVETGYEGWTPKARERMLKVLGSYDAYEDCVRGSLLPDHKFPEIRWDETTREENPEDMPEAAIRAKFQLLSNQRNQQKREVCRACFQTGKRGKPFGINFFYEGNESWPQNIPKIGKTSERGCIGCGWHDLALWRRKLNAFLENHKSGSAAKGSILIDNH